MSQQLTYYQVKLEQILGIPFTTGNKVKILKNGNEIFPSMLHEIEKAKEKIEFLTFVYWTGNIATEFAEKLAKKADEGVDVYVILDSFGAAKMPDKLLKLMKKSGVIIEWFRPIPQWKVWKIDNRTHRKVLICDGKVAFTGGVGIAEEWEGDARNKHEWRDTHFRIEGPAVFGLQAAFMENWIETGHSLEFDDNMNDNRDADGKTLIQVIRTSSSVRWSDIVMLYQALIKMANETIKIETAYFNPNEAIINLLKDASERGVDVQIMMPGKHTDKQAAKLAGDDIFKPLLDSGIHLWYYQKTMLHNKIITIDNILSCVGSANFNHRSMLKDDEVNVVIIDEDVTGELNNQFDEDLQHCEKINEDRWKDRSYVKKAAENVAQIFRREI